MRMRIFRSSLHLGKSVPWRDGCLLCMDVFRNSSIQYKQKWNGHKYQNMNYLQYHFAAALMLPYSDKPPSRILLNAGIIMKPHVIFAWVTCIHLFRNILRLPEFQKAWREKGDVCYSSIGKGTKGLIEAPNQINGEKFIRTGAAADNMREKELFSNVLPGKICGGKGIE